MIELKARFVDVHAVVRAANHGPVGEFDTHVDVLAILLAAAAGIVRQRVGELEEVVLGLGEPDVQHEGEPVRVRGEVTGGHHDVVALHEHEPGLHGTADIQGAALPAQDIVRKRPQGLLRDRPGFRFIALNRRSARVICPRTIDAKGFACLTTGMATDVCRRTETH